MAQTKRKRKGKHRGTQAGTIEARGRTGRRPQTQVEAKKVSRDRRAARFDRPPTWRGALNRAAISAAVFAVAVVVVFQRPFERAGGHGRAGYRADRVCFCRCRRLYR